MQNEVCQFFGPPCSAMVPAQLKYNRNKTVKQIPLRDDEIVSFQLSNDTREIKH